MENTSEFVLPEIATKTKKLKKETKQIIEERPRLPRTNRTIKCAYCSNERILNPDQYQSLFDYWGTEEKIERQFMCKDCDVAQQTNPVSFGLRYSELLPIFTRKLRACFEVFNASTRGNDDIVALQNMVNSFLTEIHIDTRNAEYGTEPSSHAFTVKTLKINKIPFVGTITFQPYEPPNNRFKFH